jgi:hypothetical protein
MADSIPWFKAMQSVSRGFRPGMEVKVVSAGKDVGDTMITVDIESDEFRPWRETFRPHYAEYRDAVTFETYWKRLNRLPKMGDLFMAENVIRHNEDGTYEFIKNRETGELRKLTEQEIIWLMLKV